MPMINDFPILVVDDDENYPKIMQEALRIAQVPSALTWVDGGEAALKYLDERTSENLSSLPKLILLDINMPGMNGFEFLRQFKQKELLQTIPVLMLSVSQSQNDILLAYKLGANAYLTKPTDFKQMQEMIQTIHSFWFQHAKLPFFE